MSGVAIIAFIVAFWVTCMTPIALILKPGLARKALRLIRMGTLRACGLYLSEDDMIRREAEQMIRIEPLHDKFIVIAKEHGAWRIVDTRGEFWPLSTAPRIDATFRTWEEAEAFADRLAEQIVINVKYGR